jgi:hypothetical protein
MKVQDTACIKKMLDPAYLQMMPNKTWHSLYEEVGIEDCQKEDIAEPECWMWRTKRAASGRV